MGNLKPLLSAAEAFAPKWHWSSTQLSRYDAFYQGFNYGNSDLNVKSWDGGCARLSADSHWVIDSLIHSGAQRRPLIFPVP